MWYPPLFGSVVSCSVRRWACARALLPVALMGGTIPWVSKIPVPWVKAMVEGEDVVMLEGFEILLGLWMGFRGEGH
jgi:hypothetical protein